ncbi:MAG: MBL fold metallo-hydrolase [Silicimonas sp.]|nr:MBL fold metallo-hydrolase [Silicimonas sp.]
MTATPPAPGAVQHLAPGIRAVLAPNPGPMTHWGTNSYIVGDGRVAVIDPGPASETHLAALLAATEGETISHILVTHAHLDHSPLARPLAEATGAPVHGFGPAEAGRSAVMVALAAEGLAGGGEGVDRAFAPDVTLGDGDRIKGDGWTLEALHTPGHFAGHLAFALGEAIFTGDHVMDWASSLVSPPDGDLGAFMRSSERLKARAARRFYTGHGAPIEDPAARLDWLTTHRRARETALLAALGPEPQPVSALTARVYTDIAPEMLPAAERNVFAHLIDLVERDLVRATPRLSLSAGFARR